MTCWFVNNLGAACGNLIPLISLGSQMMFLIMITYTSSLKMAVYWSKCFEEFYRRSVFQFRSHIWFRPFYIPSITDEQVLWITVHRPYFSFCHFEHEVCVKGVLRLIWLALLQDNIYVLFKTMLSCFDKIFNKILGEYEYNLWAIYLPN